ncbi:MAG: ABC transporter ATP-binding protein [Rhodospirillaceae bacterium]
MSAQANLVLRNLRVHFGARRILDDVTLDLTPGALVGLVGPNGAGKTTLLRACASLVPRSSGDISLGGRPIEAWDRRERARTIGYLAQEKTALWPMSAGRLVALGRLPHLGPWDGLPEPDEIPILEALRATDVMHLADRAVTELSGGELTRVLVARLLAGTPEILLADEPVSGLDPAHTLQVLAIFRALAREGRTVVVVLHDLTLAARFCDRLVLMDGGKVVADGSPVDVLTPEHLARHYGINADIVIHDGARIVVPRARAL